MSRLTTRRYQTGIAASMTILAAILFLGFLMAALYKVMVSTGSFNEDGLIKAQAKYAAMAAINRGFAELDKDPGWRKGWPNEEPLHQNPYIRYKLKVLESVTQAQLGGQGSGTVASGTDEVYLFAQGFTEKGAGKALAAAGGTAYRPGGLFSEACFADSVLTVISGHTDGFDSRKGDHWYNPDEEDEAKQTLVELSGNVGSNRSVTLQQSEVDGDLILPQPDSFTLKGSQYATQSNVNLSGSVIKGEQVKPKSPREIAEVDPPFDDALATAIVDESNFDDLDNSEEPPLSGKPVAKVLEPGAYGSLSVPPGKVVELHSGTYYFKSSVVLDDAVVTLKGSGAVRIFIGEALTASHSTVNPSHTDADNKNKKPAALQLLFADKRIDPDSGEQYSTFEASNSSINAVALGAKLQVKISDSEYFGAVQGHSIEAQNTDFHYDLALEDLEIREFSKWKLRGITALPPGTTL